MANRPTIADIAQRAGVSVAPVARVLNGHGQECLGTVRRVYDKGLRDMVGAAGMEWTA
ncbi:LacI family DNA-binding transcriptional regulator [Albidovulum aquaemixtae]|uniref:LacI family DNA-binding transcriptional regulator n=1 Tax=Albidovulum aquaemixtae TaxID=1542388 RepID=UPI000D554857|nr:LacI family DNA-binding transcriptional regulator [Defluviimonas aquaemixtae]